MKRSTDRRFDLYRAQCRSLKLDDEARERILQQIRALAAEQDAEAENCGQEASRPCRQQPVIARSAAKPFWRRPLPVAITCAAAALALVAALPVALTIGPSGSAGVASLITADNAGQQTDALETAPSNHGFAIRAYAAGADDKGDACDWGTAMVSGSDQPVALFYSGAGGGTDTLWAEENGDITYAEFLQAFTVEGDAIERIQIHVSEGELYRQTIERDVPIYRRQSLRGPDPSQRGKWYGYEDCDALGYLGRLAQDENGHQVWHEDVTRLKRIGTVIDLSRSDDERIGTRDIQFGQVLMATTPADSIPLAPGDGEALKNMLEKPPAYPEDTEAAEPVCFTITVTFTDGTCKTQVIELRDGWAAADEDGNPIHPVHIETTRADPDSEHVVYGAVVEENNKPFPYADLPANEYADTVMLPTPAGMDFFEPGE